MSLKYDLECEVAEIFRSQWTTRDGRLRLATAALRHGQLLARSIHQAVRFELMGGDEAVGLA